MYSTPCEQCSMWMSDCCIELSWWSMVQWLQFVEIVCFCRSLATALLLIKSVSSFAWDDAHRDAMCNCNVVTISTITTTTTAFLIVVVVIVFAAARFAHVHHYGAVVHCNLNICILRRLYLCHLRCSGFFMFDKKKMPSFLLFECVLASDLFFLYCTDSTAVLVFFYHSLAMACLPLCLYQHCAVQTNWNDLCYAIWSIQIYVFAS